MLLLVAIPTLSVCEIVVRERIASNLLLPTVDPLIQTSSKSNAHHHVHHVDHIIAQQTSDLVSAAAANGVREDDGSAIIKTDVETVTGDEEDTEVDDANLNNVRLATNESLNTDIENRITSQGNHKHAAYPKTKPHQKQTFKQKHVEKFQARVVRILFRLGLIEVVDAIDVNGMERMDLGIASSMSHSVRFP